MTGSRAGGKLSVGLAGAFVCLALWIAVLSNAGMVSGGARSGGPGRPFVRGWESPDGVMIPMLDERSVDVPSDPMATRADKPLLAPGNEAEWAQINEEEARQEAEFATSLSMDERVTFGQMLSQQAVSILVASVEAGHAPRRALWS